MKNGKNKFWGTPPPKKIKLPKFFFVKTEKIKVVQNCVKWQENWSKTIFGFLLSPLKKIGYLKNEKI